MSADEKESVGLLVLGMHRSGTSLLTRVLALSGAWLGQHDDVWATGEDNPSGFWEHRGVRDVNLQLLRGLGADWDMPLDLELANVDPRLDVQLKDQAAAVVDHLRSRPVWAIKDPRLCLTLPWWRPLLGRTVSIVSYRSPVDIARSLRVRDGFSLPFGIALWELYTLAAARHAHSTPHLVVSYDDLIDHPDPAVGKLCTALELFNVALQPSQMQDIEAFIRADLRHSRSGPEMNRRLLSSGQWEIYEALKDQDLKAIATRSLSAMARQTIEAEKKLREAGLSELSRRVAQIGIEVAAQFDAGSAAAGAIGAKEGAWRTVGDGSAPGASFEQEVIDSLTHFAGAVRAAERSADEARQRAAALESRTEVALADLARQIARHASTSVSVEQMESLLAQREKRLARRLAKERRQTAAEVADLRRSLLRVRQAADKTHDLEREVEGARGRLREYEARVARLQADNATLTKWLSDVLHWADLTWDSARWKLGNRLVRALEIMLLRSKPKLAADTIREVQRQFASLPGVDAARLALPEAAVSQASGKPDLGLDVDDRTDDQARDFFIFPIIDWEFRIQRPQHLAKELARAGHRVFYLTLQPALKARQSGFRIINKPARRVHVLRLAIPSDRFPNVYEGRMGEGLLGELRDALTVFVQRVELRNLVSIVDLHFWRPLAASLPGAPVVYDCMDHHGGFSTSTEESEREEDRLIRGCDLLIVTSRWLWNRFAEVEPKALVPNAGEIEFFAKRPDRLIDLGRKPVAGYIGAIADWFDVDLVVKAAKARPDIHFVLVGSTAFCDTKPMEALPNVALLGEVPYLEVPRYLHAFDCCIIPFRLTKLIQATNPVKIYEYLAAGKPIVSTNLPELQPISGLVHLATDADEFLDLIDTALIESRNEELAESRIAWARGNDWSHRRESLLEALEELYPRVSVVVLCFNNLDFTRACLSSLLEFSDYPNLEVIVVDNGSTDGTPDYLSEFAERHDDVKVILNESNLGFAAGNNVGMAAATGEYLVILNNDTFVTRGWLYGLVRHLRRNPKIGLIGPVTNNIGNEARIEIHYANMQEMAREAFEYTAAHGGELLPAGTVAFFCVAMPRQIFAEIGPMDEQFGQGFFEDDDYCRRVTEAGYEIVIAEDVFIHHHLSATFAKEDEKRRRKLFEANKRKYEAKWGRWQPHAYRTEKAS